MNRQSREQKLDFIRAVSSGQTAKAKELARSIKLSTPGTEIPLFLNYKKKNGKYHISWNNLILSENEFKLFNNQCPIWWNTVHG